MRSKSRSLLLAPVRYAAYTILRAVKFPGRLRFLFDIVIFSAQIHPQLLVSPLVKLGVVITTVFPQSQRHFQYVLSFKEGALSRAINLPNLCPVKFNALKYKTSGAPRVTSPLLY